MRYFYIYSAGGGAGDWNGVKRIWKQKMPAELKQSVLLKFGDVFFNHASLGSVIKPNAWQNITNIRTWLAQAVQDDSIYDDTDILLDNGTSKIVNYISHGYSKSPEVMVAKFDELLQQHGIMQKYAEVIVKSDIQDAVTIDIPNTFKIRSQSQDTATTFFDSSHHAMLLERCAGYANQLYELLGRDQSRIMTTINGQWSQRDLQLFLSKLTYTPAKLAVGGLTRAGAEIESIVAMIDGVLPIKDLQRVHFLGCGGIKNSRFIKAVCNGSNISVDNSTPMNRAIDGNTAGTAQSGYFDDNTYKLHRIKPETADAILALHATAKAPAYSVKEMKEIFTQILLHQSGHPSFETYNARAQLSFHNHNVFRVNAR